MIEGINIGSIKDRMFPNYDGGDGVCGFFWFVCLELLWGGAWGFEVFWDLGVCLFICFGWLVWFCFFSVLLQKHVYEMNVCREMHIQSHGRIKCF